MFSTGNVLVLIALVPMITVKVETVPWPFFELESMNEDAEAADYFQARDQELSNQEVDEAQAQQSGPSAFRHIGSLDMDLPGMSCPPPLHLRKFGSNRVCEKNTGKGCASMMISAGGQPYTKVRGKIAAYAYRSPDGFRRLGGAGSGINDPYVDGVSITYGYPRKHVWTYAAAGPGVDYTCPEIGTAQTKQPAFVGNNYICTVTSQLVKISRNGLWDVPLFTTLGNCVGDCPDDLTFCVTLPQPTSANLELRICADQSKADEDVYIKSYDFYVQ